MEGSSGTITIQETLPILAKSERARNDLSASLGPKAVDMLLSGKIEGDLGDKMGDFFADLIHNDSKTVSEDELPNGYAVGVNMYEGIYYVWSEDYWDTGYFLSEELANEFISMNW